MIVNAPSDVAPSLVNLPDRFRAAIRRFDEENGRDPNLVAVAGTRIPFELFYSRRVTEWVLRLRLDASEALLLASRCQHLCRWKIPRSQYPEGRTGYLRWRTDLKQFHAARSGEILRELGYPRAIIERVHAFNLKANPGKDPELQVLEDALCLVTLEYQLSGLIEKHSTEKLIGVLRKTWLKMSAAAHQAALALPWKDEERELIKRALEPEAHG